MTQSSALLLWAVEALIVLSILLRFAVVLTGPAEQGRSLKFTRWLRTDTPLPGDLYHRIALLIISLIAVGIRCWDFGIHPGGFNQDGAMAAVDAKALADYGTDRFGMRYPVHFTAWGYGQMSVLLSYLMAPLIKLFGMTPLVCRLPQLFASLGGLIILYLFIRDLFGRRAALIVLAFAAINPWHIMQSRWALDCNLFPHFFLAGTYFLYRGIHRPAWLCAGMMMLALCMYSYGVAFLTVPLFLFFALIILIRAGTSFVSIAAAGAIYTLVSAPVWLVMAINTLGWETIETAWFTMPYFPHSVRSNDILFFAPDITAQLQANFQSLLNMVFLQRPDLPWNALDAYGTIYLCSMPFFWLGLGFLLHRIWTNGREHRNRRDQQSGQLLVLAGLLTGLWAGIVVSGININRGNLAFYFTLSLAALGIWCVIRWLPKLRWPIIGFYSLLFAAFTQAYFGEYQQQIARMFFAGFGEALHAAEKRQPNDWYITSNSQYPGSSNVSEILTLFHLNIDAQEFQGKPTTTEGRPYRERFHYVNYANSPVVIQRDSVYIVNTSELSRLDNKSLEFEHFDGFSVAWMP